MILIRLLTAAALIVGSSLEASAKDPSLPDGFWGHWQGIPITSHEGTLPVGALDLSIKPDADGFHLTWQHLGSLRDGGEATVPVDARFLPSTRPGVYEYVPNSGSLLTRMFASPSTGNPLEGETLLWARVEDETLIVYSMMVEPKGGFDVDRYQWTRTATGLRLLYSQQSDDPGGETRIEGDLVARGG